MAGARDARAEASARRSSPAGGGTWGAVARAEGPMSLVAWAGGAGEGGGCPQHDSPSPGYEYSDKKSKSKG